MLKVCHETASATPLDRNAVRDCLHKIHHPVQECPVDRGCLNGWMSEHHDEGQNESLPENGAKSLVWVIILGPHRLGWIGFTNPLGLVRKKLRMVGFAEKQECEKLYHNIETRRNPEYPSP